MSDNSKPTLDKFFDLYKAITQDPDFKRKVQKQIYLIDEAEKKGDREARGVAIMGLLRLCDYNLSLLVPFFFPNFSNGKPMSLSARPHAYAMMAMGANLTLTVQASRQVGKCVSGDTEILIATTPETELRQCQTQSLQSLFEDAKRDASLPARSPNRKE